MPSSSVEEVVSGEADYFAAFAPCRRSGRVQLVEFDLACDMKYEVCGANPTAACVVKRQNVNVVENDRVTWARNSRE